MIGWAAIAALVLWCLFTVSFASSAPGVETPAAPTRPAAALFTATVRRDANLRAGPGTTYAIVGIAKSGASVVIVSKNRSSDWYQLDTGAWIAALLVQPVPVSPTPTGSLPAYVTLGVGSWNVESGDADPHVVGERLAEFAGVDLWGLSEVLNDSHAAILEAAAEAGEGANFARLISRSGNQDRLVILYNADRFERLGQDELEYINIGGTVRAPLLVDLRDRQSGQRFVFMVNHLNRGNAQRRHDQAALLNEWAIQDERPAIAVGDYNFDWAVSGGDGDHDLGYDYMTAQNEWLWVRPTKLTTTQCAGWPCAYHSVLDFVFTANGAQDWPARAEIIVVAGDFPDDQTTSDHRPVLAWFQAPVTGAPGLTPTRQATPQPSPTTTQQRSLMIIGVNKRDEYVDVANQGSTVVDLAGWVLRSEKGHQDCPLRGTLAPGQTLRIWAMSGQGGYSCRFGSAIWNNNDRDPAVLLEPGGSEVSRYE
jgi:endonuclease/exonuclease/phosphatase family metal-dependent hydrolase